MITERIHLYQKEGIEWLWTRIKKRKGAILGDEMGMGKTMQVLSVVKRVWESIGKSILIMMPTTLLENWENEMTRFNLEVPRMIIRGGEKDRIKLLRDADDKYIALISYEHALKTKKLIASMYFDLLVLDEAHRIKNRENKISQLCRRIDAGAKICITGTPIQNNLSEMWSIVDIARPGLLGDPQIFKTHIEEPLKRSKLKRATTEDRAKGEEIVQHLKKVLSEVVLRRTKQEVGLSIPEKIETVVFCPLTPVQQELYQEALQNDQVHASVLGQISPLKTIIHLKKICNHPLLHTARTSVSSALSREYNRFSFLDSGKIQVLLKLLFKWRDSNRKIVLFSQYKDMLTIIEQVITIPFLRIDGDTPVSNRLPIIESFGKGPRTEILLLTTKVGGVGINIPLANTVILYDMDWNPFNDEQAKGRAHRIGQKQIVSVYRLMCKGTIEESVSEVQEIKKYTSQEVLAKENISLKKAFNKIDMCRLFHYSYSSETELTDIDQLR
ncbi:DNA excision repair protein ERCC-6 [Nematocida sp. AWRm80]|nr:DNA excision repair protein ERCC-6 [Nematocida sp. AWRm80]